MTGTQADLTERARALLRELIGYGHTSGIAEDVARVVAALQSEREAAAAEARRAAPPEVVAWCATLYRITEHHLAKTGDWADGDIAHLRSIIALLNALASPPAPQEETR